MNRAEEPEINLIETITLPHVEKVMLDNGIPVYLLNAGEQEVVKIELLFNYLSKFIEKEDKPRVEIGFKTKVNN